MAKKKQRNASAATTQARVSAQAERQQRLNDARATATRSSQRTRRRVVRRNTTWWWIGGIVAACVVVVIVFVVIANNQKASGVISSTANTSVLKTVTSVSPGVLSTVGTGGLQSRSIITPITKQSALAGPQGKPEVFYYGAEWCPYCAATRWSVVVALSRFGTFSKLPETLSSSSDVYPNTATFSFHGSTYSSSFIDFVPLEVQDRNHNPLQTPTASEQQLLKTFNVSSFPFIDIANKYQVSTPYDPSVLTGLSQAQITSKLSNPNDTVTQNIVGGANYLTAAICAATQNQPASVCSVAPIPSIMQSLALNQGNALPTNEQADIVQNQLVFVDRRRV